MNRLLTPTIQMRRTQPSRFSLFSQGGYVVDNYTVSENILQPSKVALEELKNRAISEMKIVGLLVEGYEANVWLTSFISTDISVMKLDLRPLYEQKHVRGTEYMLAEEILQARLMTLADEKVFPITSVNRYDPDQEEPVLCYLSENQSFYVIDYTPIRRLKQDMERKSLAIDSRVHGNERSTFKAEPEPTAELMLKFIEGIKIQQKSIKVNCGDKSIYRYDPATFASKLRNITGRTSGATIGGLLRRMRNGSYTPSDCLTYVIKDSNGDRTLIMSLKTGAKTGHSFIAPYQSIDMYIDFTVEKFGEDKVIYINL